MTNQPMSDRPPKFAFKPTLRAYGKLDIVAELIICTVNDGRIQPHAAIFQYSSRYPLGAVAYPKSWEEGVQAVGTVESYRADLERANKWNASIPAQMEGQRQDIEKWQRDNPTKKPRRLERMYHQPVPVKLVLMGLNDARDAYTPVYDPHGLEAEMDDMMLLNFRRIT